MMLPGNGWPVTGFLMAVLISEKFPWRISVVGTEMKPAVSPFARIPSYAPMKKVLLWPS